MMGNTAHDGTPKISNKKLDKSKRYNKSVRDKLLQIIDIESQ